MNEGFDLAVWTRFSVMSVTPKLSCGQDEVPPRSAALSFDADFDLFGMVELQLQINMSLCSRFGKFLQF